MSEATESNSREITGKGCKTLERALEQEELGCQIDGAVWARKVVPCASTYKSRGFQRDRH